MQTPAGFEIIEGKAYATSWFAIVFNPITLSFNSHVVSFGSYSLILGRYLGLSFLAPR